MKNVVIIGTGISGMSCALGCVREGCHVVLVSSTPSEFSQSVLAAGGINAVLSEHELGDSVEMHVQDTIKGGCYIAGENAVRGMCEAAESVVRYLERIGTVFSLDENGRIRKRAFGAQSYKRTCYCGTSTGKQIVSAMSMEVRRCEAEGTIERRLGKWFYSALIRDGVCYGVLLYDDKKKELEEIKADAVVMATGGQNALFGMTTGSIQNDGYAAGKLFLQGVELKNLEFVQYHPTTVQTPHKRMLISESVRGEGGRLFCLQEGKRVYFMENRYGEKGNLMPRDIVSREIAKVENEGKKVFLDISFMDRKRIDTCIPEVRDLCKKYCDIDISKEPIPVSPAVHFFMGGIAVHLNHETNIRNLYAVGECASMYHGANRLGGNSLLAAFYGGKKAALAISSGQSIDRFPDFSEAFEAEKSRIRKMEETESDFPSAYIWGNLAECMGKSFGIVRDEERLKKGMEDIDYYLRISERIHYDKNIYPSHINFGITPALSLAKAALTCAQYRKESRGAHYRSDYPDTDDAYAGATIISYDGGKYRVYTDREGIYES